MINPADVPPVTDDEKLARFVLQRSQIRRRDQTIKPEAFIPHPHTDLSVTRHLNATEFEIWSVGRGVAQTQGRKLYGRADIRAAGCRAQNLSIRADPIAGNPNHANIHGWPTAKQDQKAIALKLAAVAKRFIPNPNQP